MCPDGLVKAVLSAIKLQAQWGDTQSFLSGTVEHGDKVGGKPIPTDEDDLNGAMLEAWDDLGGEQMDGKAGVEARQEEITYYHRMEAFDVVPKQAAIDRTGKKPIGVRWLVVNNGDKSRPIIRSRSVAHDYKLYKDDDLYAGAPTSRVPQAHRLQFDVGGWAESRNGKRYL